MYCTICEQDLDHNCQCGTNARATLGRGVQQCERCEKVPYVYKVDNGEVDDWLLCTSCFVKYEQAPERAWEGSL